MSSSSVFHLTDENGTHIWKFPCWVWVSTLIILTSLFVSTIPNGSLRLVKLVKGISTLNIFPALWPYLNIFGLITNSNTVSFPTIAWQSLFLSNSIFGNSEHDKLLNGSVIWGGLLDFLDSGEEREEDAFVFELLYNAG